jgi:hypothetical protein
MPVQKMARIPLFIPEEERLHERRYGNALSSKQSSKLKRRIKTVYSHFANAHAR